MPDAMSLPKRADIPAEQTWDKVSVYASDGEWEAALRDATRAIPDLSRFRGRLGESAAITLEALRTRDEWQALIWRIRWYAAMQIKVDITDQKAAAQHSQALELIARVEAALAYIDPELLILDPTIFAALCVEEPKLVVYTHYVETLRRRAARVRSAEVETLLAQVSELTRAPYETYKALVNGELAFGSVTDADGAEVSINQTSIVSLLRDESRPLREAAWRQYADGYLRQRKTLAALLGAAMRADVFFARARGYPSALDAALDRALLPRAVFDQLLASWRAHLPVWHRYWRVRARARGVDQLAGWDIDVPLVRSHRHIPYDEARRVLLEAMAPLGEEYVAVLRRGLYEERWVDWAVNEGKTGGAEQSGAYELHPFVLLSYDNSLLGVSALAHEMGHAMHTRFTNQSQPAVYENYADYLGETASTFSQTLLRAYLLGERHDPDLQLGALADALTYFHRYLFVMPLLAQFELDMHERIECGEALSADEMSARMLELLREGYGPGVALDAGRDGVMWAQFSHLYLNFYTYTYGLGLSAATALAGGVLHGRPDAATRYLAFLKAGDSIYPLDAWRLAGVDMSAPEPVNRAFGVLEEMIDRLDALVGAGPLT
jgi:oligoendopeptidase F